MSLVARYKLDDAATLTTDSVGSFNLTNVNNVGTVTDPTYGTAATFVQTSVQGDETYLHTTAVPDAIGGNSVRTYSAWVRPTGTGTHIIHGQGEVGSASGPEHQLMIQNDVFIVLYSGQLKDTTTVVFNTWYNIVVTYDGTTERMYIDGVFKLSRNTTYNTHTTGFAIGHHLRYVNTGFGGFGFNGQILDYRIYDDALSAGDITDLYNDGPNPVPLVDWVLDANNKYEVSSRNHLIQIMHNGALYTNTGSVPTDFSNSSAFYANSSFIQTADIDLEGDSTNILPIGYPGPFQGVYDGNGFTISNWVYADPNYPSASAVSNVYNHIGLFGYIQGSAIVKNIRMAGVCSLSGFRSTAGLVAGWVIQSSSIYNIDVDLSPGSFVTNSTGANLNSSVGGVIGALASTGTNMAITLNGELTIHGSGLATGSRVGGMIGDFVSSNVTLLRNLATFPTPITGSLVGGIFGRMSNSSATKVLNAMTGDITETSAGSYIGGIAGQLLQNNASQVSSEYVNSMKGNITGTTTNSYTGGMFGLFDQDPGATIHSMFNYMTGDVTNTFNADRVGGLVATGNADTNLTTSINAMNGFVRMPTTQNPSSGAESNIDISFGLTYDIERNITTTPLGLPTDPEVGLPIFDFIATDPDSVVHTFDFVFGNLPRAFNQLKIETSGEYLNFAELEIKDMTGTNIALLGTASGTSSDPTLGNDGNTDHLSSFVDMNTAGGPVTWTLDLDKEYTLAEINTVTFYNRGGGSTDQDRSIGAIISFHSADGGTPEQVGVLTSDLIQEFVVTVAPEFLLPTAGVTSISATVVEVTGALTYQINITESPSGTTKVAYTGISTGDVTIGGLTPETTYILQLYADTGGGYQLEDTEIVTTLANTAANYDVTVYGSNGDFDLSVLDSSSFALLDEVINDLFTTGDKLEINLGTTTSDVAFVKVGEAVSTDDSILVPFSSAGGAGQAITMNLSDTSTVAVSYDDVNNSLTIGADTVQVGDSIIIDGKKLTVKDI